MSTFLLLVWIHQLATRVLQIHKHDVKTEFGGHFILPFYHVTSRVSFSLLYAFPLSQIPSDRPSIHCMHVQGRQMMHQTIEIIGCKEGREQACVQPRARLWDLKLAPQLSCVYAAQSVLGCRAA